MEKTNSATGALSQIKLVKQLSPQEAAKGWPVRLRGVVVAASGRRYEDLFLQDATGGIYLTQTQQPTVSVQPGTEVVCEGITAPGHYAPIVRSLRLTVVGRGPRPEPIVVTLNELTEGRYDATWVEVRGVVRSVKTPPGRRTEIQLALDGGRLMLLIQGTGRIAAEHLVDAEVRVRGAAGGRFNLNRQLLFPVLNVPGLQEITVERSASQDPFSSKERAATELFRYASDSDWRHRCVVRGVVVHQWPGKAIFLRAGETSLFVESELAAPLQLGVEVEVAGFPAVGQHAAYLENAVCRVRGDGPTPTPVPAGIGAILEGKIHHCELVALEGWLIETTRLRDNWILTLKSKDQAEDHIWEAHLRASPDDSGAMWPVGSRLRLTGVCWLDRVVQRSGTVLLPGSFHVLLRSPGDVALLEQPSWWTRDRLLGFVALLAFSITLSAAWVGLLRRQVRVQSSVIALKVEREAIAEERARVSREIHDTLAQGFMALGFQLEALTSALENPPSCVRLHLDRARWMLRHCHEEVRRSLRDLRGQALDRRALGDALRELLPLAIEGSGVQLGCVVTGTPFPLHQTIEHNLLRVAQEAVTNALRHAHAQHLTVELRYDAREVRLCVEDDGRGFAQPSDAAPEAGHFGLQSMRERAKRIGTRLEITARPSGGTQILLAVPRTQGSG
ncbi:MAG: sensor histidine kinase [Limisphaerales bacterium]